MGVSREDVERAAELAGLRLSASELESLTSELNVILEHFEALRDVDTSGVDPALRVLRRNDVLRPDEVGAMLTRDEALSNAPDDRDGCFAVPHFMPSE
jgi:aspartyl-tRNA(Asn)/glutamyl-tRNA(Gln) amidotransferase subunit C